MSGIRNGTGCAEFSVVLGWAEDCRTETTLILFRVAFSLLPNVKGIIKETCFEGMDAIKRAVTTELRGIPEESFRQCVEAWQRRIGKCIRLAGS